MPAARSWSVTSTPSAAANAVRSWADAGDPSSSAHPTSRPAPPLPWKMNPNRKMKMSGKARVQNRAARSRTKPRMFAMVRADRARIVARPSVAKRSTGQVEEDVFEGRAADAEVARLHATGLAQGEERPDRRRDIGRVQQDVDPIAFHRDDRRQGGEIGV